MANLKNSIEKLSYSSDEISVHEDSTGRYIIKSFNDPERGKSSSLKQQKFSRLICEKWQIDTPKIIEVISNENEYKIVMEYIDGYSGCELDLIDKTQMVFAMKNALSYLLAYNFESSIDTKYAPQIFIEKLNSIKSKNSKTFPTSPVIFDKAYEYINSKPFWLLPVGDNHGDLTLTNIIATGNREFYLIDFIPAFIESPLWDLTKLEQDLSLYWSARYIKGAKLTNFKLMANAIMPGIHEVLKYYYQDSFRLLMILCMLRICPYIRDKPSHSWLNQHLNTLLNA